MTIDNVLIAKINKAYHLQSEGIADAVELYYDVQKLRIMHQNKERTESVRDLTNWLNEWLALGEKVLTSKLTQWCKSNISPRVTKWAFSQIGIGPIMAAGLAAYIDIEKASSISALWKYAGLAPGFDRPVKGQKLPYNNRLKTLCWKLGESFVKVSGKDGAFYGQLYLTFKADEISKNESGKYKEAADRELSSKKFKENATKKRLLEGKLSDAHLHSKAKRKTEKMFLAHYWTKGREYMNLPVRQPYAMQILGHDGIIEPAA